MGQMRKKRTGEEDLSLTKRREPVRGRKMVRARDALSDEIQDKTTPMLIVDSDVEALYPSLHDIAVADIYYQAVMNTTMKFHNINYKEAVRYIALNWTAKQCKMSGLARVLPRRAKVTGTRPGMTGEVPLGPDPGGKEDDQWVFPKVCLTDLEKKMIIATVVQIGVVVMFNTHIYQFNQNYYLQKRGGPIGLRATCAVARVCMLHWDGEWLERLASNNIRLEKGARYMDDLRAFLHGLKMGWRWHAGELWWC